jgi:glycosyltransferase involved in cell wall biosynthesis
MRPRGIERLQIALLTRSAVAHYPAGGMELHTEVLRRGLAQRGHMITTLTTPHPERVITNIADEWGETRFIGTGPSGAYSPAWHRESVSALMQLHAEHPVDIVVSQSGAGFGYLASRASLPSSERLPVVLITHGNVANEFEVQLPQFTRRPLHVTRWLLRAASVYTRDARYLPKAEIIVTLSPSTAVRMRRWFRLNSSRIEVIPNGIDVQRCLDAASQRERKRADLGVADGTHLIVGVGNFVTLKGFHHLLEACAQLRNTSEGNDVRVALVGDGIMADKLRALAQDFGLTHRVTFTGRVSREQVPAFLCAADIVAMPSLQEGVPLALLEAMACARPVVVTPVGGIPDIVEHQKTALLVPPANPAKLAQALLTLMEDRALADSIGMRAQAQVREKYDESLMVERYEQVMRSACEQGLK